MLENYCIWASECISDDLTPGMGKFLQELLAKEGKLRQRFDVFIEEIEGLPAFLEEHFNDESFKGKEITEERKQRTIKRDILSSEKMFWADEFSAKLIHPFLTDSTGGMALPPGHAVIRQDVARRCRERLANRQISLTEPGDFSTTEEIVRWLGYDRIYDNQDECLFTGIKLDAEDIDPERDIIESSVFVPLLDTSDVPRIRIHRSVIGDEGWRVTREGCSFAAPHVLMNRYQEDDVRTQVCHVTGQQFQRSPDWLEGDEDPGHWLIPVNPADLYRFRMWLHRNNTPQGLAADQWSTRWLQPRVAIKSVD